MVTIVTSPAYDNSCAEVWFDPATLSTPDPEIAEQAAIDATWALWALSGYRFHGPQCWVEDYRTIRGYCHIKLRQNPVTDIVSVTRVDLCADTVAATGVGDVVEGWCDRGKGELKICCGGSGNMNPFGIYAPGDFYLNAGCGCSTDGSVIRVHYKTGNNLPPGASRAAFRLGEEYVKASTGQACALPERVTSINRQGASWTILDPQDFLEEGLTGIGPVDQWLSQVGLRSRWMDLTDPLRSVPLVASTQVGCGNEDCFASISP